MLNMVRIKGTILLATLGLGGLVVIILGLVLFLPEKSQMALKHQCFPHAEFATPVDWRGIVAAAWILRCNEPKLECIGIGVGPHEGKTVLVVRTWRTMYIFERGFFGLWKLKSKGSYHYG